MRNECCALPWRFTYAFALPASQLPPNYGQGRAFQRVSPGQAGLPICTWQTPTMWMVKFSHDRAARFASPEALGRGSPFCRLMFSAGFKNQSAWRTYPQCRHSNRTYFGNVRQVHDTNCTSDWCSQGHLLNANPFFLGLVRDELLEFGERPLAPVTDVFEISGLMTGLLK